METPPRASVSLQTETPSGLLKTRVLTLIVIVTQVVGNISLSRGMHRMQPLEIFSPWHYLGAIANPWALAGIVILMLWMITNLVLLSRADLSYVLPVTAVSYVLIAIVGHFLLGERVSGRAWVGIVVITLGVMLVGSTPTRTVPDVPEEEVGD